MILELFEFQHLFVLTAGVLLGIIVGALPGLTPTMGVALCIPFTFSLPAVDGLLLLGGIYCGSVYGGTVPAIMFNVPGAPASVATTFDGYPMAQQGKARKALELATISSFVGGLFGMLMLIFFAPMFVSFSLQFGPAENFWLAIFGITVISAISQGAITKELLGGCAGILLSFIGISSFTGMSRFTFGHDFLVGGLHVVAVLIGLFAFPQALRLIKNLSSKEVETVLHSHEKSSIRTSFSEVVGRPKSVTIGSIVGSVVGVIPGAGGNIASIMAYNEVKRFSKNKERFGKGNPEGVIASESANNAMVGGSLIPLLSLGIPGSPTAAIFLGGLLIHGIWPGRSLFVENAPVVYTFFTGMIIAQFLLLFIGLGIIRYLTKLNRIPDYFMAPIILSFCIIGAYATQNNLFDIYTMVILGAAMYVLQKYKFSAAPIALGFILGPIAEEGLLQGIRVGEANGSVLQFFFTGGWNISLFVLVIVTIAFSIWQTMQKRPSGNNKPKGFQLSNLFSFKAAAWLPIIGLSALILVFASSLSFEEGVFPQITAAIMVILSVVHYIRFGFRPKNELLYQKANLNFSRIFIIAALVIISLLTNVVGFYNQVLILMLLVSMWVYWQKNKDSHSLSKIMLVSLSFTLFMFLIFSGIVKVPVPTGLPLFLSNIF
ncbi:putative tricarboxylic transport membrane protein [Cytobacillus oceanisediminis]|uniref:Putative tricarboxylic transport membrane protein n=1 Tax=Cytobacillus oceanisediminis TaxID=665099 RepID=A0A2V3A507_9BACI|nr:tripartite tricarboxylate transporter permease [Cytobacillus oceanisediminis]PWW32187.1 putative tricarboxylic transport membrane protein [Cytobacillus oceanisediminis]